MRNKTRVGHSVYNDGVFYFGKVNPILGKGNKKIGEEFKEEGYLFFELMSARNEDAITADAMGYVIDKKIKAHYLPSLTSAHKVRIKDQLYDIKSLDNDRTNMFLYLQKAGV